MKNYVKYSIYTEDKGNISAMVSMFFDGCTVTNAIGYWKGIQEDSVIITIVCKDTKQNRDRIEILQKHIKVHNKQESVLVTCEKIKTSF